MATPSESDLESAAQFLREAPFAGAKCPHDIRTLRIVASWLEQYARNSKDRAEARRIGCTVKYLRKTRRQK